jgi:hypothetical protein
MHTACKSRAAKHISSISPIPSFSLFVMRVAAYQEAILLDGSL